MSDIARMPETTGAVDLDAIGARIAQLRTAALLAQLDAILVAIDSSLPERQRRRSGFFGRLAGRDLVAQAHPDDAGTRVRLHLAAANDLAEGLAEQAAMLDPIAPWLREQAQRLRSPGTDENACDDPQRRTAIAATWETTAAHVDLVRGHAAQVLRRHAQVRDVLVPTWRQQMALAASSAHRDSTRLDEALRGQIAAFRDALPAPEASTDSRLDPALAGRDAHTQEPTP